ncbi:DEAD-box ATP-dependent RNA helicase 21 [Tanacetum coccineum]
MQKLNSSDEIIGLEHHLNELKKSNRLEDNYNNTSTVLQTRLERLIKVKERIYRTTYMFSATMPTAVERLARKYLRNLVVVTIGTTRKATEEFFGV